MQSEEALEQALEQKLRRQNQRGNISRIGKGGDADHGRGGI